MGLFQFQHLKDTDHVDIAIVGAGISGLYCAWRLIQQDPSRTIAIVERLNRTGGRLDTDLVEIKPGQLVREEEGGMRFNYGMDELMRLNAALGLCGDIVPFPMSSADHTNRYQLHGHSFTVAEAEASGNRVWGEIYDLKPEEIGLSPTDLVTIAYKNILSANGAAYEAGRPPEFWTQFRETFTWGGKTLNQWQLWGLLRDMNYSQGCIQMLSETIGFAGPFLSLANAGDAFQILADFPENPAYFTFERGFSTLPDAIVTALTEKYADQVRIALSCNVDRVRPSDSSFELDITQAPDDQNSNPHIPGGQTKTLCADTLILAVATRGMERLFITSPALNAGSDAQKLWDNIHAAMGMNLMKINLYFDAPWWEDGQTGRPPVQFGPNFTNLPVNAVYPFYTLETKQRLMGKTSEDASQESAAIPDGAAALTIYCDFNNTNFWRGLQNIGPAFTSTLQEQQNARRPQTMFPASQAVVDEARKQLQMLFDVNWVPKPVLTSYRLWNGEDDFEFAYHQWRLNVVDSEVRTYLAAPRDNLHFCNEAISDMHGWVNGSLRSCDAVLKHFGLEPMDDAPCQAAPPTSEATPTRRVPGLWGG